MNLSGHKASCINTDKDLYDNMLFIKGRIDDSIYDRIYCNCNGIQVYEENEYLLSVELLLKSLSDQKFNASIKDKVHSMLISIANTSLEEYNITQRNFWFNIWNAINDKLLVETSNNSNMERFSEMDLGKTKKLYKLLMDNRFISKDTKEDVFCYWFGHTEPETPITKINWENGTTLKDIYAFVNVFYPNENKKWEKATRVFTRNGNQIKISSLKNAISSIDVDPDSKKQFEELRKS